MLRPGINFEVRIVAVLRDRLAPLDDAVLRCAHELASAAGGARESNQRVERHTGGDHLAQERRHPRPPPPALPRLGDHESDPRRDAHEDGYNSHVLDVPGQLELLLGEHDQKQRIAGELDQHHRTDATDDGRPDPRATADLDRGGARA